MKVIGAPTDLTSIEADRRRNMRQLLLRASRIVNRQIVEGLNAKGYDSLRSTHTTLLSNIDLAGSTVTVAAERAGITKQAMGRLATELEATGYVTVRSDPADARVRILELTEAGRQLMRDSFEVMTNLERSYAQSIGEEEFAAVLRGLAVFVDQAEQN
jgi:DNA-binding MarR family transcriptional regulator